MVSDLEQAGEGGLGFGGDEGVDRIAGGHDVLGAGDTGFGAMEEGDKHAAFGPCNFRDSVVGDGAGFGDDGLEYFCAAGQVQDGIGAVEGDIAHEFAQDGFAWADSRMDLELLAVAGDHVGVIGAVDEGQAVACAQALCLEAGHDIVFVIATGCDEEVGIPDLFLLELLD